ncbi:SpoIIE family protein phosphatase [Spirochaetota bacterium]
MERKIKVSLKVKYSIMIIILIFSFIIASFISTGYFILSEIEPYLSKNFITETKNLLEYFSSTIYDGLIFDDDILLINTFEKVKSMQHIEYAVLFDRYRKVYLHSEIFSSQNLDAKTVKVLNGLFTQKDIYVHPKFDSDNVRSSYFISRSFYDESGAFFGMLLVRFSTSGLRQMISNIQSRIINVMTIIAVAGIVISILFGIGLATFTVRPINTIVAGTEIVGSGNLDHEIPLKRNDELGFLSDNFNAMTKRIKEAQDIIIEQEKQEEQLQIARQIQESTLPEKPLIKKDYAINAFSHPAKIIGGDFFYYDEIDKDHTYFLLADVSGKGVPAALVAYMISIVLHSVIQRLDKLDTSGILNQINRIIAPEMIKFFGFATMMLCIYKKSTGTLNFTTAGQGYLNIYRANNNKFEQIDVDIDLAVGAEEETTYQSHTVKINQGDIVTVFSDGVNEARNDKEEEYGFDRFFNVITKHHDQDTETLIKTVNADIKSFVGETQQHDDMTLMFFKRNG